MPMLVNSKWLLVNRKEKRHCPQHGFTLIELLVVIAILAILSIIGLVSYSGVQKNARDSIRRNNIDQIATALDASKVYNGSTITYTFTTSNLQDEFPGDAKAALGSDPSNRPFCVSVSTTSTLPTNPNDISDATWSTTSNCSTITIGGDPPYASASASVNTGGGLQVGTAKAWKICTRLEAGNGANIYCRYSK